MNKKILHTIGAYQLYLSLALVAFFLAPISDIFHWVVRAYFFAALALYLLIFTVLIIVLELFFDKYPRVRKKLPRFL